ncbi:hypothetical protein RJT34_28978 [Clitoria ternatea]|uniref:Cyclotide n=1 Tax=Clitoria ternatea TaxID=43366 RepID=A0AAN9FID0_CLITE
MLFLLAKSHIFLIVKSQSTDRKETKKAVRCHYQRLKKKHEQALIGPKVCFGDFWGSSTVAELRALASWK